MKLEFIYEERHIPLFNRIFTSFIIFSIYVSLFNNFLSQMIFYTVIGVITSLYIIYCKKDKIYIDGLIIWVAFLLFVTLSISLFLQGAENLTTSVFLIEDLIIAFSILVFGIKLNDIKIISIFFLVYLWITQLYSKGNITHHDMSLVGVMMLTYFLLLKRKKEMLIFFILLLPLATRAIDIALLSVFFIWLFRNKLNLLKHKVILYTISILYIVSLLIVVVYIGIYIPYKESIIELTTIRSIHYGILFHDIIYNKGISIFFPSGNLYVEHLISSFNLSDFVEKGSRFYTYLAHIHTQCTHCTFLEWIVNYGIFITILIIYLLLRNITITTFWFILVYIIGVSLHCKALSPQYFTVLYMMFYLSKNNLKVIYK